MFSLREVINDENVQPKMQCLMVDSSFSMVTMQGEDSGIAWETTPSCCSTPWASEAGIPAVDLGSPAVVQSSAPGTASAGKIIFVMDEELLSRRKKTKEKNQNVKPEILLQSSENILERPELVEVSQPNVKIEEEDQDPLDNLAFDKEQRLFSLVSDGSEILNIVVPTKLATVDEEESKEMVDNLSYLEMSPVPKASEDTHNVVPVISTSGSSEARGDQIMTAPSNVMDPPGAPVARGAAGIVDYFEAYTLINGQAPGSPAVIAQEQVAQEAEVASESEDAEKLVCKSTSAASVDYDPLDTSPEELTNELLDEVFYGSADIYPKNLKTEGKVIKAVPSKVPPKLSGSNLFGSQDDVLTPIFLPERPPKIIDPILLEEPKAMAFLYTDLYEEAVGCRKKEEDTESVSSEKSFHSRHSEQEAMGYLEKYVLIDETPVVEVEPTDKEKHLEECPRVLPQDLYDFGDLQSKPKNDVMTNSEEEITEFFRSSADSSPCDVQPFVQSLETEEPQITKKTKDKPKKIVPVKAETGAETLEDLFSISSFEFLSEELDWGLTDDRPTVLDEKYTAQERWKDVRVQKPMAPPRKKALSPKACLDLTPLTPVDVQEKEEASAKDQRGEAVKEEASPAETSNRGKGDESKTCSFSLSESVLAAAEFPQTESANECKELTVRSTNLAATEGGNTKMVEQEETYEAEAATKETEPEEDVDIESPEPAKTTGYPGKQEVSLTNSPTEPAKENGHCIIL